MLSGHLNKYVGYLNVSGQILKMYIMDGHHLWWEPSHTPGSIRRKTPLLSDRWSITSSRFSWLRVTTCPSFWRSCADTHYKEISRVCTSLLRSSLRALGNWKGRKTISEALGHQPDTEVENSCANTGVIQKKVWGIFCVIWDKSQFLENYTFWDWIVHRDQ